MNTNPSSTAPAIAVQPGVTHSASATHAAVNSAPNAHGADLAKLALGALGVVYGDVGTSRLYAIRECVPLPHGEGAAPDIFLGLLSLVCWALTLVSSIKYLRFVMRADIDGVGGV